MSSMTLFASTKLIQRPSKRSLFRGFSKSSTKCTLMGSIRYLIGYKSTNRPRRIDNRSMSHHFSTLQMNADDPTNDLQNIPWFPRHRSEIDRIIHRTINASPKSIHKNIVDDDDTKNSPDVTLSSHHPGFCDPVYRKRRTVLAQYAQQYHWDHNHFIPYIDYTESETQVWTSVYDQMIPLIQQYACTEYQNEFQQLQDAGIYTPQQIPQQSSIYTYLYNRTQFRLRPVAGLLQSRDFLNALALRIFCSTQYIRHPSQPYYTPEPDICHELLGHVPLLGNPVFANLSQQIGLASLGASDDDVVQLAKCYWHSVEFGLCLEHGTRKAYGAGLLSSYGELIHACGSGGTYSGMGEKNCGTGMNNVQPLPKPMYVRWDPNHASQQDFPITTYQPMYYVADSIMDALDQLKLFCDTTIEPKKAYTVSYNSLTERIDVQVK